MNPGLIPQPVTYTWLIVIMVFFVIFIVAAAVAADRRSATYSVNRRRSWWWFVICWVFIILSVVSITWAYLWTTHADLHPASEHAAAVSAWVNDEHGVHLTVEDTRLLLNGEGVTGEVQDGRPVLVWLGSRLGDLDVRVRDLAELRDSGTDGPGGYGPNTTDSGGGGGGGVGGGSPAPGGGGSPLANTR